MKDQLYFQEQLNRTTDSSPSWGMLFFFIALFVFGMFFNDILGLSFLDELMEVLLLFVMFKAGLASKKRIFEKDLYAYVAIVVFYAIYSLYLGINSSESILFDILIQSKPYIAFWGFYCLDFEFSELQKRWIRNTALFLFLISVLILLWSFTTSSMFGGIEAVYTHLSKFYTGLILIGLTYLLFSEDTIKSHVLFFIIISFGLLTLKGKMYGFFAASMLFSFLIMKGVELKVSLKNIFLISGVMFLVAYAAREKVSFYFFGGTDSLHSLARPALYVTSLSIFQDYFPFGSGFASFATHASKQYYSPLYETYDLDMIWGLSREMPEFIADTFFPSLAQFGVLGIILFTVFWIRIVKMLNQLKKDTGDRKRYLVGVLIIAFLFIELVADAAYTNNRGFFTMALLALVLKPNRKSLDQDSRTKDLQ